MESASPSTTSEQSTVETALAHSIGLSVIAEGVSSEAESHALPEFGVDGLTGPAIGAQT